MHGCFPVFTCSIAYYYGFCQEYCSNMLFMISLDKKSEMSSEIAHFLATKKGFPDQFFLISSIYWYRRLDN